ncbi:molecular chaperone GrpE [Roseinatronobacter thiooxidans]|uniref:Protein GrpE n=2 Tax=Roseinatronobacter thiooxidans TaxID=121821 RepID=A0A2W7QB18_9RHOB|nr:molecular chaperone GrpE [Roseinatronobacter thiooxidans]
MMADAKPSPEDDPLMHEDDASLDAPEAEEAQQDPVSALEAEIDMLIAQRDEMRDRMIRALADAENSRKRAEKDRRDAQLYGGSKIARDMLPVYDNLTRALNAATEETRAAAAGLVEGVELTLRELTNILTKHGVQRISPEVGEMFDPHSHQAMFEAPVPDFKAGQIIQVMAEGFMLHDQLLRPAHVGVSSTPAN